MFKVGDKVKVIGRTYYGHNLEIGSVGEIVEIYSDGDVDVRGVDAYGVSQYQILNPVDVELYAEATPSVAQRPAEPMEFDFVDEMEVEDEVDTSSEEEKFTRGRPPKLADKVVTVKKMYRLGMTQQEIADAFDVSIGTINNIINNKTYGLQNVRPQVLVAIFQEV